MPQPSPTQSPSSSPKVRADLERRVQSLRLPSHVEHRGGRSSWFGWLLSMIIVGTSVWLANNYWNEGKAGPVTNIAAPATNPETPVKTTSPASATAANPNQRFVLESRGYIVPVRQILVSPQVSGRLTMLQIEEGQLVEKGTLIATIERTEYESDYQRAEALLESAKQRLLELEAGNLPDDISQAESELAEVLAQLKQLESEYHRLKELHDTGATTTSDFEKADSAYQAMLRRSERLNFAFKRMKDGPRAERIGVAHAEVKQLEAELQKAKWRLDNCTIKAPITGTILRKNAEEGNIVNPIAFNGSFSICDMADLSELEVELNIQERDISQVFVGQECEVRTEAFPKRLYAATIVRLMPIADRAKGAIPVRARLVVPAEEAGAYLKPEMSAIVAFLRPSSDPVADAAADAKPVSVTAPPLD